MKIKEILIAVVIIGIAVMLSRSEKSEKAGPHDTGNTSVSTPRKPYPCEYDRSTQCTWEQYWQIAEEECAKDRARGGRCKIVTNGKPPHAVHIPSDSERADMRQKVHEDARRLCDNLTEAGYECRAKTN